ncbi:MAG: MarR family transcriptional regulator [Oscillospiraceae bacterium]|jgi:DNA-binding MarR family transcriptional regulator|nr:MarR family transcriptional regulator [Oscillospiraceae bacterium]
MKPYEQLKLKNQLCFPLYAAAKEVVGKYKPFLDGIGLTYTQYIAMMVLWERKEIGVKELGEYLYLESSTLTPLLKRLESKGFLARNRSDRDERSVIITLTEEGERLKEQAAAVPAKLKKCLPLTENDAKTLYHLLYKLLGVSD